MKKQTSNFGKIIIPVGVFPERHELETVNVFAQLGKDIEFIKPRFIKGQKNPDIKMDGQVWEIKVPVGKSKRTIENNYRTAQLQSENVIFDIRRIKIDENLAISQIRQQSRVRTAKRLRRIKIIIKSGEILDING